MKKHLRIMGEYVGHLAVGAVMFTALLLFGGALNLLVHWIGPTIGDESFYDLMKMVEQVILYADVAFVVWWAVFSTYKTIKEMMNE